MDVVTMNAVALNSVVEMLHTMFFNVNYALSDSIVAGAIVGGCTLVGGLIGGRFGLLVGGGIGTSINTYLGSTIRSLRQMLQDLTTSQLQNLFILLSERVQSIVRSIESVRNIASLSLITLIERYGSDGLVRLNIIQTITDFLVGIHGNRLNRIEG